MEQNPTNLEAMAKSLNDSGQAKLTTAINSLHDDIVNTPIEKIMVPALVFETMFLDTFKQAILKGDVSSESPIFIKWIELVGGPYKEADIVDNKGVVLFTTPPLYAKPTVDESMANISFDDINGKFRAKSNRLEIDGINYLTATLSGIKNKVTADTTQYRIRWMNIFKRFDKPAETASLKAAKANTVIGGAGIELNYD